MKAPCFSAVLAFAALATRLHHSDPFARYETTRLEDAVANAPGRVITLGGYSAHVVEKGSGPAILLIHGLLADTRSAGNEPAASG